MISSGKPEVVRFLGEDQRVCKIFGRRLLFGCNVREKLNAEFHATSPTAPHGADLTANRSARSYRSWVSFASPRTQAVHCHGPLSDQRKTDETDAEQRNPARLGNLGNIRNKPDRIDDRAAVTSVHVTLATF